MKFRDREKRLLVDVFLKTAEYILAIVILGQAIAESFELFTFLTGLFIFLLLVCFSLILSSLIKEEEK
ncbi:MAG: hypothetical protein AB1595_00910 [bacterium]